MRGVDVSPAVKIIFYLKKLLILTDLESVEEWVDSKRCQVKEMVLPIRYFLDDSKC